VRDDYYVGVVTCAGAKNPNGEHTPLIDSETFERVQEVLEAHSLSGDRSRKHEHYLNGSLFCGQCGGRLVYTPIRGHGGHYEYFKCFSRHNQRSECDAPHVRSAAVEVAIERWYQGYPWLTADEKDRVREAVRRYGKTKLEAAKKEADRAARRIEALKAEQQHLLQLSYKGLVDEDVLAAEQSRIKHERAQATKWTKTAQTDVEEIALALEEALRLLEDPVAAYHLADALTRRMLNQALFERLEVHLDGSVSGTPTGWFRALQDVSRDTPDRSSQPAPGSTGGSLKGALDRHEARKHLSRPSDGPGLNEIQMVRPRGLEPPRTISPQGPQPCASTNSATGAGDGEYSPAEYVRPERALSLRTHVRLRAHSRDKLSERARGQGS
jgi:site-specific DNA recombinase